MANLYDLYGDLPDGMLFDLCTKVYEDRKKCSDKTKFFLEGTCAGGIVMPLMTMNNIFPFVTALQACLMD